MDFNDFFKAYLICALWSSTDDNGDPLDSSFDIDDIAEEAQLSSMQECQDFFDANAALLLEAEETYGYSDVQAGHDFWLTRNGHGAGFWDRGMGEVGEKLTKAAKVYSEGDFYVGDDGKIYC